MPPRNGRLPRGLCGRCVVETIKAGIYELEAEPWSIQIDVSTRMVGRDGYVTVVTSLGRMSEHKAVMQQHLGRSLIRGENVHHINGDRGDNRVENLELWNTSQPAGQRVDDKLAWAHALIEQYERLSH